MPNPKKKKDVQNTPVPNFTSACSYVSENISEESAAISAPSSKIAQRLNFYRKKAAFPDLYDILNGKLKDLQEKRLGKKDGLIALTAQQVKEILSDEFLDPTIPQGLLYRVFFHNATIFACQGGIEGGNAHCIQLPPDPPNISGPASDLTKYISKRPLDALNPNWRDTSVWAKSESKTSRGHFDKPFWTKNCSSDANVPEDAIMNITGHKSLQGVCAYKNVNESQKINTIKALINTMEPNQESSTVLTEITGSHINFNSNTITNTQVKFMVNFRINILFLITFHLSQ
ncbi:15796_t:CDS:2 [Gigaspora rosea]|nr:15796_t:CDS:2 [Gigaspora rosea]